MDVFSLRRRARRPLGPTDCGGWFDTFPRSGDHSFQDRAPGSARHFRRDQDGPCWCSRGGLRFIRFSGCSAGNRITVLRGRKHNMRKIVLAAALALPIFGGTATAQETVKIGYIDPLSGGGASVGEVGFKTFQFLADELNAKGGILGKKVEIVPLDNKTNPQESLIQAQKAIDSGVRYLTQGKGH